MTRRILRLFVLSLALGACGGGDDAGDGGVRATFDVTGGGVEATAEAIRDRARALDLAAEVTVEDRALTIEVPGGDPPAAREEIARLSQPGRVAFYDWETSVVGPGGRPAPENARVTGGPAAALPQHGLPPDEARARARDGMVVVRALPYDASLPRDETRTWYVLRDDPALTGEAITDAEQDFDAGPRGSGQPVVVLELDAGGRAAFERLARAVARRGVRRREPQHFVVVLDDEIVGAPAIDPRRYPDGFDARHGVQLGTGLTIESAQELAAIIDAGPLPARLSRQKP